MHLPSHQPGQADNPFAHSKSRLLFAHTSNYCSDAVHCMQLHTCLHRSVKARTVPYSLLITQHKAKEQGPSNTC